MVTIIVTDKNAIYVDNTRITDRSTKWGIHNIVDEWDGVDVVGECLIRGHRAAVEHIDDPAFDDTIKAALGTS